MSKKVRTVITTDGEVDDMNSLIRFLLYANEFDLEGVILTSSVYHYAGNLAKGIAPYRWTGTEWLDDLYKAYDKVLPNLQKHANGYPSYDKLREITKIGNITVDGEMTEKTEGAAFLEDLILKEEERMLYIQTWGGTNTTARALKNIEERFEKSADWESIKATISKRVTIFIILDQDTSYKEYIEVAWPGITVIKDEFNFWHFAYAWKNHLDVYNTRLQGEWFKDNIKENHGALLSQYHLIGDGSWIEGELDFEQRGTEDYLKAHIEYKPFDFISEGDSPSFLYLLDNGLRSTENPTYGGWGGRFKQVNPTFYVNEALDKNPASNSYEAEFSLIRWFDDIQDDFAVRADWCVKDYEDTVHYPGICITQGVDIEVVAGQELVLTAECKNYDQTTLDFSWWRYFEADNYKDDVKLAECQTEKWDDLKAGLKRDVLDEKITNIFLSPTNQDEVKLKIPLDVISGDTFHVIFEAISGTTKKIKKYQRVILTVV